MLRISNLAQSLEVFGQGHDLKYTRVKLADFLAEIIRFFNLTFFGVPSNFGACVSNKSRLGTSQTFSSWIILVSVTAFISSHSFFILFKRNFLVADPDLRVRGKDGGPRVKNCPNFYEGDT